MRLKMFKNTFFPIIIGIVFISISCGNNTKSKALGSTSEHGIGSENKDQVLLESSKKDRDHGVPVVGANQTELYLKSLNGKKVGIVANQSSVIFKQPRSKRQKAADPFTHLVDSLLSLKIDVKSVFAPEHGFRGTADAGEQIKDGMDKKTGIPIISLYGDNKKPKPDQLKGIELMVFDLQDVGVRFYTYISTLHYVMEACAEANIPLMVLDRPNPNGNYIDGPILEKEHSSFVGMHPIPVVHGMTIGEYAQMINGEKWLKNGIQCKLSVIPIKNYNHQTAYSLPIKPSPNLPNDMAVNLYPSLCLFEGTNVSVGRGTSKQFQIYGSPYLEKTFYDFKFVPQPNEGAKSPLYQGRLCYGKDLSAAKPVKAIELGYILEAYSHSIDKKIFFNDFFSKLAGNKKLRQQIEQGLGENAIKASWQEGLANFRVTRKKYLLYEES